MTFGFITLVMILLPNVENVEPHAMEEYTGVYGQENQRSGRRMTAVILYEWIDENGEVEDFIVLDAFSLESSFFQFPDAVYDFHFGVYAEALLKDYCK
jgi:hypothetical protein